MEENKRRGYKSMNSLISFTDSWFETRSKASNEAYNFFEDKTYSGFHYRLTLTQILPFSQKAMYKQPAACCQLYHHPPSLLSPKQVQ